MLPPYESPYKHLKPPVNNSVSSRAFKLRFLVKSVSLKWVVIGPNHLTSSKW